MKTYNYFRRLNVVLAFLCMLFLSTGCPSSGPFDEFNFLDENMNTRIENYYLASNSDSLNNENSDPKVYIDFSSGLVQAYTSNSENANMLEKITQKLTGSDIRWFGMGNGKIYELDFPTTQLFNKVTDPKSYSKEIMAPIEGAIKEITSSDGDALLITDFEEYTTDGKEQFENFAKGYFISWLSKGNSIDFLVTNYNEKTKDKRTVLKHLYFIIFNHGKDKKLLADVNYAIKDRGYNYEKFSLSTDFYKLSNDYGAEKKGGNYYNDKGEDIVGALYVDKYINGLKKDKNMFEFYPFTIPWKEIYENSKALMEPGVNNPFTNFFSKLYIDASNEDVFQLKELKVKVSDITNDYLFFAKTEEVKKHKPKLGKDASGNSIFSTDESDPIALDCYNTDGSIKDSWIYKPIEKTQLNEVFELNKDLYNNGYKESKNNIEIGIKFHNNFNGSQIIDQTGVIRVDVVISDCTPNFDKLSLFKWESSTVPNKSNESLAEAIRNTLDKVNPKDKVIYTYFIQILGN